MLLGPHPPGLIWPLWVFVLLFVDKVISIEGVLDLGAAPKSFPIITGFYDKVPKINIRQGQSEIWTWDANTGLSHVPVGLQRCIKGGVSATEVKFAARGKKIVAIIGNSAVVINHAPGAVVDKTVDFAVCLSGKLAAAHTAELLPGNLLAVATTGQQKDAGVWVYDASKMVASPQPVQQLPGVRAIHGMLWDQQIQTLWVTGNTDAADGTGGTAYGIVQGYKYDKSSRRLTESTGYTISFARRLSSEWDGAFAKWWNGPHDLVPVPSKRILLFPMDRDIHAVDLSTGTFNHSGAKLAAEYLKGFRAVDNRIGYDGEALPRSDIKSISLHPDGGALYTQAPWRAPSGLASQVNLLSPSGVYSYFYKGQTIYRSRVFAEIPGWPTA
ncbi:WD40/YVTN repeat-like-containing domain protein [Tolypocladium capitatum]|uniref:WD40/YVTN repeat-like-containing domain protein n=1 Tax=Tolypocladium capitatum TaxID=45235 RepID=A0A2K3Q742_9HYPO|nr:WD40/YVTN repeat-like-containing domain protein [Tolypocladium capitatum]